MPGRGRMKESQAAARGLRYEAGREMYEDGVPGMSRSFAGSRGMADSEREVDMRMAQIDYEMAQDRGDQQEDLDRRRRMAQERLTQ